MGTARSTALTAQPRQVTLLAAPSQSASAGGGLILRQRLAVTTVSAILCAESARSSGADSRPELRARWTWNLRDAAVCGICI